MSCTKFVFVVTALAGYIFHYQHNRQLIPNMYEYRKLTENERRDVVEQRKKTRVSLADRPPHPKTDLKYRIVTATCFEHKKILDLPSRLRWFEHELLESLKNDQISCAAWCVLPNHYHLLVCVLNFKGFSANLGILHGRTSFKINKEDQKRGRKVWCGDSRQSHAVASAFLYELKLYT